MKNCRMISFLSGYTKFYSCPIAPRNIPRQPNMNFYDLQQRLLNDLRRRVRSGEITERRLARQTGISQPHIHQVLKGKRVLSPQKADDILRHLRLDLLDLVDAMELLESRRR